MQPYNFVYPLPTVLLLAMLSTTAVAQISLTPSPACDPSKQSCTPGSGPKLCTPENCLADSAAQALFEKTNNCTFPGSACGNFNKDTQCCGKDPKTGKARVIDKVMNKKGVISPGLDSFTWTNYTWACPDKKQNNAPPNTLWQKCEVGKKHSQDDDYEITEVKANGTARPYCIEGCSIPPAGVALALATGVFLVPNRDNPSGHPAASFYDACANHDVCYQTCDKDQAYCDNKLESEAGAACQNISPSHVTEIMKPMGGMLMPVPINTRMKCEEIAAVFRFFLHDLKLGKPAFDLRRQQYCQCC
jgi:hypothetical protein